MKKESEKALKREAIIEFCNLFNTVISYGLIYLSLLIVLLSFGQIINQGYISLTPPYIIIIGFGFGFAMWLRKQECYFSDKLKQKGGKEK